MHLVIRWLLHWLCVIPIVLTVAVWAKAGHISAMVGSILLLLLIVISISNICMVSITANIKSGVHHGDLVVVVGLVGIA